jgi:hypothetical protein
MPGPIPDPSTLGGGADEAPSVSISFVFNTFCFLNARERLRTKCEIIQQINR